jgi:hypothetical protein
MNRALPPDLPTLDTFGAPKRNFSETEDPTTSADCDDFNALAATAAAFGALGLLARVTVSAAGALISYKSVWGDSLAYAPDCAPAGTGIYTVTLPAQVPDLFDGTLRAVAPGATSVSANTSGRLANSRHVGQVVTVETVAAVGGGASNAAFTLLVFK